MLFCTFTAQFCHNLTQNHHQKLEAQLDTQFAKQVFNLAQWSV